MRNNEVRICWAVFNLSQFRQLASTAPRFLKAALDFSHDEIEGLVAVERAFRELKLPLPENSYHQALLRILSSKKYSRAEKEWATEELERRWYYSKDRLAELTIVK